MKSSSRCKVGGAWFLKWKCLSALEVSHIPNGWIPTECFLGTDPSELMRFPPNPGWSRFTALLPGFITGKYVPLFKGGKYFSVIIAAISKQTGDHTKKVGDHYSRCHLVSLDFFLTGRRKGSSQLSTKSCTSAFYSLHKKNETLSQTFIGIKSATRPQIQVGSYIGLKQHIN